MAAGCGGDDESSASPQIEGLGSTLEEIQANAKEEGEVNIVQWAGYVERSWTDEFAAADRLQGQHEGRRQLGRHDLADPDGRVRRRLGVGQRERPPDGDRDVAPVNTELIPNYADVQEGIKNQSYNSLDGEPYGVPHGRGANYLMFRNDDGARRHGLRGTSIWEDDQLEKYKGKISIYDDSIFIADAALSTSRRRSPTSGSTTRTSSTRSSSTLPSPCSRSRRRTSASTGRATSRSRSQSFTNADSTVGTTWPYQYVQLTAAKPPVAVDGDQAEGGHDRLVGHVDDLLEGREPELHVPLDGSHDLAGGAGSGGRGLRRGAGQPEGL